jgi:hypothetical protein
MTGLIKIGQELIKLLVRLERPGTSQVIDRPHRTHTLPPSQLGDRHVPGIVPLRFVLRAVRSQGNRLLSTPPSSHPLPIAAAMLPWPQLRRTDA